MKIHTTMPERLKLYFRKELEISINYFLNKDFSSSWHHLERAHILGQPFPFQFAVQFAVCINSA